MFVALLALVAFLLVVEPLLVALHEFGHAVVPLALGRETAVFVGGDRGPTVSLGSLTLTIAPAGFLPPVTGGATVTDVQTGRWAMLGGALGGPVTSLLATTLSWIGLQFATIELLWWIALYAFVYAGVQTLSTLIPLRTSAAGDGDPFRTDGRIALELLLGRDPVLDADPGTSTSGDP